MHINIVTANGPAYKQAGAGTTAFSHGYGVRTQWSDVVHEPYAFSEL